MINREIQLISKVLQTGDFRSLIKSRITKGMFGSPEARAAFRYLWDYYYHPKHPGCIPKRSFFYEKFPSFPKNIPVKGASLPELCERVREMAISRRITDLNNEVITLANSDPYRALDVLRDNITKLQAMTASTNNILLSDLAPELIAEYELVNKYNGMMGVPFPFEKLNRATGGMQEEDFILIYADHKTMKSFLGLFFACHAYKNAHRRVMYYAAEMNRRLIGRRTAACYCKLDYDMVKRGRLPHGQAAMYVGVLQQLGVWEQETLRSGRSTRFHIVKDDAGPDGKSGIYQLMAEIEAFEPDIVFCDSFYRMANDYDWKVQANLTKMLKATAERYKIPIVGISQRNRDQSRGAGDRGMGDIGYTLAGAQETDLGFRIVYDGENDDGSVTLHFVIAAAREIKQKGFTIRFAPYTKAEWVGWLTEDDLAQLSQKQKEKSKKRKSVEEAGELHREHKQVLESVKAHGAAIEGLRNKSGK